jgi:hypothetical protein
MRQGEINCSKAGLQAGTHSIARSAAKGQDPAVQNGLENT